MAYNCWYSGNNIMTEDDYLAATVSGFEAMGWTLHDSFDAGSYPTRVLKNVGESGEEVPCYVEIWHQNATYRLRYRYWLYWDAGTHTGETQGYYSSSYTYTDFTPGYPVTFYGDADWTVMYVTHSTTTYYQKQKFFARPKKYVDDRIVLTEDATSGSNKVLTVSGSLGKFESDRNYVILGDSTEGRDKIHFDLVNNQDSTVTGTVQITNLPRAYKAGAIIEHTPCTFAAWTYNEWRPLVTYDSVGTNDFTAAYEHAIVVLPVSNCDPDTNTNRYILQPELFREATNLTPVGYLTSSGIAQSPIVGAHAYDAQVLFTMGDYETGSSTNSSTSTMLNDSSKAWTTDEHVGKVFVFTNTVGGNGEGQTRVIASNDATNLYWNTPLHTKPVQSDEYRIYDGEVWRRVYNYACRELIY